MVNGTARNKKWLGFLILFLIFFFLAVLPVIIISSFKEKIKQFLPKPATVETPCFKFNVSTYFKPTDKNDPQKCTIETKDFDTTLDVTPVLFREEQVKNNLKQIADNDKNSFLSAIPTGQIESEGPIQFAGLAGYGYVATFKPSTKVTKKIAVYWVYNPQANEMIENVKVKVFGIIISSSPNTFVTVSKDIEKSWQWTGSNLNNSASISSNSDNNQLSLVTPCFKTQSQLDMKETYKVNDCDLSIELTKNANQVGIIGVHPFIKTKGTLTDEINDWKKFNNNRIIVSEKDLQIGNSPAHQIVHKFSPTTDILQTIIFVYTGNRYETIFNYPVNGFEITSLYDDNSEIKTSLDYLVAHWTWL